MLTSNPARTGELQLEKEHSRISRQIQNAQNPARFPIKPKQAVTLPQFSEALLDEKPAIVHFSGHGEINNAGQEIQQVINRGQGIDEDSHSVDDSGIILNSPDGREPFFVGTSVIKRIFQTIIQDEGIPIQAVIFNSCYSEAQAKALAELVPHVIGTSWKIKDDAAIAFADGFYSFFIRRENFQSAWNNGVNQAMAYNEPADRFIYYKDGKRVM